MKVHFNDYEEKRDEHLIGKGKKYEVTGFPTIIVRTIKKGIELAPIQFNAITYDTMVEELEKIF